MASGRVVIGHGLRPRLLSSPSGLIPNRGVSPRHVFCNRKVVWMQDLTPFNMNEESEGGPRAPPSVTSGGDGTTEHNRVEDGTVLGDNVPLVPMGVLEVDRDMNTHVSMSDAALWYVEGTLQADVPKYVGGCWTAAFGGWLASTLTAKLNLRVMTPDGHAISNEQNT